MIQMAKHVYFSGMLSNPLQQKDSPFDPTFRPMSWEELAPYKRVELLETIPEESLEEIELLKSENLETHQEQNTHTRLLQSSYSSGTPEKNLGVVN